VGRLRTGHRLAARLLGYHDGDGNLNAHPPRGRVTDAVRAGGPQVATIE
jgi:hypothetical protein